MEKIGTEYTSGGDKNSSESLRSEYYKLIPRMGPNWHRHALIGVKVEALSRVLYYADLYKKILDVPGLICEFGVQWGSSTVTLSNLRSIFEPFNVSRTLVSFDTFEGFPHVDAQDGLYSEIGDYSTESGYEETLERLVALHEAAAPMPHVKKHEIIKGDVSSTLPEWLERNPHAVVAMAVLDMDLYKPTRDTLQLISDRLVRGSVIVFDEFNCKQFPGETLAMREVIGYKNLRFMRSPFQPYCSWAVWE
ncbi:TylF/MycF/NovP-related O-methyltransferase [Aquibium microcysteis]|uniref:TylF/MycF/NovP-related O-methyltransferase n=1 Tax=Aquibium microcysteis TaxID=675281 RepID=UPI00165D05F6|nr:TylF/MycF/NovP-related O-methyltransferase [Aquibium microcysteis]